jgi:hypothetical protein
VVVWPETASPYLLAQDPEAIRAAAAVLPPGAILLAGTVRADFDRAGRPTRLFNSLVALRADGGIAAVYDKSHLVPFGEYMPLGGVLPIRLVTGGMDFSAGPGPVSLALPGLPRRLAAHLLRGDIPRARDGGRAAGLAGEHHQRRLVRALGRPLPALRSGTAARGRGRDCQWCGRRRRASRRSWMRAAASWRSWASARRAPSSRRCRGRNEALLSRGSGGSCHFWLPLPSWLAQSGAMVAGPHNPEAWLQPIACLKNLSKFRL